MMQLDYPCHVTPADDGSLSVTFPDVPEALTCGWSREEALGEAVDALSAALTFYLETGEPLPTPGGDGDARVAPNLQVSLKAALADALRETGQRPADLARRLDMDYKSVTRLLDPNHTSRIPALERALSALGKGVTLITHDRAAA